MCRAHFLTDLASDTIFLMNWKRFVIDYLINVMRTVGIAAVTVFTCVMLWIVTQIPAATRSVIALLAYLDFTLYCK
jgi:hypothetical protein